MCVSGGIAAYKSAELVRRLQDCGAEVRVAMTEAATKSISPLTLQALSRHPVASSLLDPGEDASIGHIALAEEADAVLIAPATADLLARLAAGMAGDMVTAVALVTRAPLIVAPSMNGNMLSHPAVRANIHKLAGWGYRIVESDSGELACGYEGAGRLPDAEVLIAEVAAALSKQDFAGVRFAISAGPTREALDPVRYISNRSSGRMGYEVAAAALRRGGRVTLVSGPTALLPPRDAELVRVESAAEMSEAMLVAASNAEVVVMVAAVADYSPRQACTEKIKKNDESLSLELLRTEDILTQITRLGGDRIVVGFAAETGDLLANAAEKLERKGLDLIVANDVGAEGSGFEVATNSALLIDASGGCEESGLLGKDELSDRILDRIAALRAGRGKVQHEE